MAKDNILKLEGIVIQKVNNSYFKVEVKGQDKLVDSYLSGRMFKNNIMVMEGDKVLLEVSTNDRTKGRITFRCKN